MNAEGAIREVFDEIRRAEELHGPIPDDIKLSSLILLEEAGEVAQAAVDISFGNGSIEEWRKEVVQTACVALRILLALDSE